MMNKELISIEPYRNIKATTYSLFVSILLIAVYVLMITSMSNGNGIRAIQKDGLFQPFMIALWFLIIGSIVWSYKVAKQTGREPALWIIVGFALGSLGLLILSLRDYYIKDNTIKNIITTTRQEFKENLRKELGLLQDKEIKNQKRLAIKQEFQELLEERCSKEFTAEKIAILKELVEHGIFDEKIDLREKARIIEKMESYKMISSDKINWKKEWTNNESICSACGTELEERLNYCLNCGLKIN